MFENGTHATSSVAEAPNDARGAGIGRSPEGLGKTATEGHMQGRTGVVIVMVIGKADTPIGIGAGESAHLADSSWLGSIILVRTPSLGVNFRTAARTSGR